MEREDSTSGTVHFFILKRNDKGGAHWILQDNTALVSSTPHSPAELHMHARLSTLTYRQWEGWSLIKYFFLSLPPSANSIAPVPVCQDAASFWYCRGRRQRICLRRYNLQVWWVFSWESFFLLIRNSHRHWWAIYCILVLSLCLFLRHSRHDPKATKTLPQVKGNILGNYNQLVTVWPGCLFLGTTDRRYIWMIWTPWPPILTSYLQGQQESL